MRITRSLVVLLGATSLLASGVVYAAWTATGSGSGAAKATIAEALTITPATITAGDLYPGITNGAVKFVINNTNDYPVKVNKVQFQSPTYTATDSATPTGCTDSNHGVTVLTTEQTIAGGVIVPANGSSSEVSLPIASMANSSDNGCQGETITIANLTITDAASNAS